MKLHAAALCLVSLLVASPATAQSAGDAIRASFGRFVAAQNAHDQIFVPIAFSIGPVGQAAHDTRFLMNQTWVRGDAGWKLMRILPIPVPPPVSGAPAKPN